MFVTKVRDRGRGGGEPGCVCIIGECLLGNPTSHGSGQEKGNSLSSPFWSLSRMVMVLAGLTSLVSSSDCGNSIRREWRGVSTRRRMKQREARRMQSKGEA